MQSEAELYEEALKLYHDRDIAGAEKIFRQILGANTHHADSLHMMAAIGYDIGRFDFAEELARMALIEDPANADYYYTLGAILNKRKKFEEALMTCQEAIKINPEHVKALVEMGFICRDQGMIFRNQNMIDAALNFLKRALAVRADEETYYNMAYIYNHIGKYNEALAVGKACIKNHPNSVKSLIYMGSIYDSFSKFEDALNYYEQALKIEPDNAITTSNISTTYKNLGRVDEAIAMQKRALELDPGQAWIYSNLILTMVYAASVSPEDLAETSYRFGETIADQHRRSRPFKNNKNPNRKLRIGYVSPDFRDHAVSYFLSPVYLRDKKKFEVFAYSKVQKEDAITEKLIKQFDHWRDIKYASDDYAADMIEHDQIDILVDLAGHTGKNGLMVFARKPAPIQITWLGHPATTGMKTMDYRITDSYAEPPGMTEHLNSETLWRMPEIFCAFAPPENGPDVIDHPPFEDNGYVTFGCFNNFTKVTDQVLMTWREILKQAPEAKLLLEISGIQNEKIRGEVATRLTQLDMPMDRVILEPRSRANQFVLYNKIDIALDPFPMVGGTTSMDTLWMGVPLITLAGKHFASRMGVTILSNVGLSELISQNLDEYVSLAVALAQDRERLKKIRDGLRERVLASPAMDQERFTRNMEAAYREMWKKWVNGKQRS